MKRCPKCKTNKQPVEFDKCASRYDGLSGYCKPCKKMDRQKSDTQRETKRHYSKHSTKPMDWRLKDLYGITFAQYSDMANRQNNLCAICNNPERIFNKKTKEIRRLSVDHSHSTGKVRELLCSGCNHAIGLVNESIEVLDKAIQYLKKHN